MPSFTVKLIYTPPPEDDRVEITLGGKPASVYFASQSVFIGLHPDCEGPTPAETLSLARALALVAGCADPRWRGWHWRAEGANGNELGETPLGQWYVNRDDCEKAVRTLFGTDSTVIYDGAPGSLDKILRLPAGIVAHAAENDAIRAQIAADTTDPTIKSELIVHDPKPAPAVQRFQTERALQDCLESMNYDHGIEPELAIVDANGSVALACGTDEGDEMGYAYYRTGPEGRMPCIHDAGSECCGGAEVDRWQPAYPVVALGAAIPLWPPADDTPEADL